MFALVAHMLENWNNTDKISMAPCPRMTHTFVKLSVFFSNNFEEYEGKDWGNRFKSEGT